jgi:hypothetical protein
MKTVWKLSFDQIPGHVEISKQPNRRESWFAWEIGESQDLPNLDEPHTHIAGDESPALTDFARTPGIGYNLRLGDHIFDGITRAQEVHGGAD